MSDLLGTWMRLAVLLVGAGTIFSGYDELVLQSHTSVKPITCSLAKLEKGQSPPDRHILLGEHLRIYSSQLVTYVTGTARDKQPGRGTKVLAVYYPIVSPGHPYARHETDEPENFVVLVKDTSWKDYESLPQQDQMHASMEGLIITDITRWRDSQEEKLATLFPKMDLDKIIVLEMDRQPKPLETGMKRLSFGILLVMLGFFGPMLLRRVKSSLSRTPKDVKEAEDNDQQPPSESH